MYLQVSFYLIISNTILKLISNQIKQLLYFCHLFIDLEKNDLNTVISDLKYNYNNWFGVIHHVMKQDISRAI